MARLAKEARPLPDINSIESPQSSTYGKRHTQKRVFFPPTHRLIVTTTRGVYAWDMDGVTELFRSGSEGIVAARKLSGTGEMLAVADSQVVVLHDMKKGMQKSYRLKGSEGQVRLLRYSGDSSQNLFFTTSLRNSVQSFSLKHSKVLDPSDCHPSPPSVFALSCTANLLLSASASPPTIHLRDLRVNESPLLVRPRCSSSAVVAAAFHPESENIFMLAFADGSAAVYDAFRLIPKNRFAGSYRLPDISGAGGEVGFIQRLHAIGSKVKKRTVEDEDRIDDANGNRVTAEAIGVTAVALVPGHRAMAITVGADGKCCVIDFTQPTRKRAVLLKSWHLRRPATSVSVVYYKEPHQLPQLDGVEEPEVPANKDYCIAVGRQDGKVLLFDLGGKPLGKQVLDPKGARVVDIEWAKKEIDAAFAERGQLVPSPLRSLPKRMSLGTEVIRKTSQADAMNSQPEYIEQSKDPLFDDSKASLMTSRNMRALEYLDLPHTAQPQPPSLLESPEMTSGQGFNAAGFPSDPGRSKSSPLKVMELSNSPPPIPPRPTPKPSGKLSMRRADTAREVQLPAADFESQIKPVQRRNTADSVSPKKTSLPKMSPSRRTLFGPRPPPAKTVESEKQRPREQVDYFSPVPSLEATPVSNTPKMKDRASRSKSAIVVRHDDAASSANLLRPSPSPLPKRLHSQFSTGSLRSYKTASSRMDLSENSQDTVVDWSASASSRRLDTSIHSPSPTHPSPQPSFFPERPSNTTVKKETNPNRKKGHESITVSAQPSLPSHSSGSHESGVSDTVVQWPALRKSPFIADLSTAIESATASVLDLGLYTDDPASPSKSPEGKAPQPKTLTTPNSQQPTTSSTPTNPTTTTSTNKPTPRFIPPRLPLPLKLSPSSPIATATATHSRPESSMHSSMHTCPCEPHLETVLRDEFEAFKREMERGFKAQRLWLEELVRGREEGRGKLEEENRVLREELASLGRVKGKGKGGSG